MNAFLLIAAVVACLLIVMCAVSIRGQHGPQGRGGASKAEFERESRTRLSDHGNMASFYGEAKHFSGWRR